MSVGSARKAILKDGEELPVGTSLQGAMPELPEVEITARLIGSAVAAARVESAVSPGLNALRSFDPPLSAIEGAQITGITRRGKLFVIGFEGELSILLHLMSAGRLQLYDTRASLRDRTARVLLRLDDGRELRLREFGTKQAAWIKLYRNAELDSDEQLSTLGPEAWPDPPPFGPLLHAPRPLHGLLRDQRVIAGIGRSWVDEILHAAMLSPFKRGAELSEDEAERLREATVAVLGGALAHYKATLTLPIPDKLPMPLTVHRRNGEPCPRCGDEIEAVFYEDYVMCYCPTCQTDGKLLKDRRLSRLLK
jgi:formamidopyrimidine-DNA glycosylase